MALQTLSTGARHVVVTGGSPFLDWSFNTSAMVRDALPDEIKRKDKDTIVILKYPYDVPCEYEDILKRYPKLWSGELSLYKPPRDVGSSDGQESYFLKADPEAKVEIDAMLHIGMRPGDPAYRLEKRARRDVFKKAGEDGKYLRPDALKGMPKEIKTDFDIDDIEKKLQKNLPTGAEALASDDAGSYFCEFQFFVSMAEADKLNRAKHVEFLHVPSDKGDADIARGGKVAQALIELLVDSLE